MMMYIILGIVLVILMWFFITFNILIKRKNRVNEAFSTLDVYLKKRWDLIPNIVETVKGYAKHEKETLKEVIELRNSVKSYDNLSLEDKINKNTSVNDNLTKLMALVEKYPDLKANKNFLDLQKELTSVEDEIAQSRKYYNAVVREFNNMVEMIPSNIVAKVIGYKSKPMFSINENEKESIKVEL